MCLVDDDRVVSAQIRIVADLGEQQTVGHDPDRGVAARSVGEAHGIADPRAELDLALLGDASGDRTRGDPSGLGVADRAALPAPQCVADLRQLRRLAGAGFTRDDDDLVRLDRGRDVVAAVGDGELGGKPDRGRVEAPANVLRQRGPPSTH